MASEEWNQGLPPNFAMKLKALNGKLVVVTGGCGFLGRHLCEQLLAVGARVRVLDIRCEEYSKHIEFVIGDLLKIEDLTKAFKGAFAVLHVASPPPTCNNPKLFYDVNVTGTKNVIAACQKVGVTKLVYTSSASVVFDGTNQCNYDENTPLPPRKINAYISSKLAAEQAVITASEEGKICACALRPHGIFGPRDPHLVPALATTGRSGRSKYLIGDGKNLVDFTYVENVAYAHLLAAVQLRPQSPVTGQSYFITNTNPVLFWDFLSRVQYELGYELPWIQVPFRFMLFFTFILGWLMKCIPIKSSFTTQTIRYAGVHHYYRSDKAYKDFGYQPPFTLEEGLRRTLVSCRHLANPNGLRGNRPRTADLLRVGIFAKWTTLLLLLTWIVWCGWRVSSAFYLSALHSALAYVVPSLPVSPEFFVNNEVRLVQVAVFLVAALLLRQFMRGRVVTIRPEDVADPNISDRTAVVVGGNRGIGKATAQGFAALGARVIIGCRNEALAKQAVQDIIKATGNTNVGYLLIDLASLDSVKEFVRQYKRMRVPMKYLVNNAGLMCPKRQTVDGFDTQVQVNYLSHFLLTTALLRNGCMTNDARIVNVSSWLHINGYRVMNLNDINVDSQPYVPIKVYWATKLMQVSFSNELNRRLRAGKWPTSAGASVSRICSIALNPGNVETGFILHFIPQWLKTLATPLFRFFLLSIHESANNVLYAAVHKDMVGVGGQYIDEGRLSRAQAAGRDPVLGAQLWALSQRLLYPPE